LIPEIHIKIYIGFMDNDYSASEAAAALDISVATLYSYVSRGLLTPIGSTTSRNKRYPREAVLRLAVRKADGKRGGHLAEASMHWGVPVLETCISRIDGGRVYYRGHDAVALADEATLERTACILWDNAQHDYFGNTSLALPKKLFDGLFAMTREMGPLERAMASMPVLGHAVSAQTGNAYSMFSLGAVLMRGLAAALLGTELSAMPLHQQVGQAWSANPAECELIRRALVILAEHELNSSAFTVRCVASTGADLPAALSAGLAALSGPKHGGSIQTVKAMLDAALVAPDPAQIVANHFPQDGSTPNGYMHRLYPQGDPRARYLLERLSAMPFAIPNAAAIIALSVEEGGRRSMSPNLDLALSSMQLAFGWPDSAAVILFALARSAGWIAHAAEQAAEDTLIRPRARYVGRF
jgi:citrate synthase